MVLRYDKYTKTDFQVVDAKAHLNQFSQTTQKYDFTN